MTIGGKKISLTTQIFVAMILGSVAGLVGGKTMKNLTPGGPLKPVYKNVYLLTKEENRGDGQPCSADVYTPDC